jgi:AcrR family transcriptional regulator
MSPRNSQQNEVIRLESKKKIVTAAFKLIAKHGYESTSISQIAKKAGVSKGLVYNYFESKEELLETMVHDSFAEGEESLQQLVTSDPAKTLENFFKLFFHELRKRPEYWRLLTELTFKIDKFKFVHDLAVEKITAYTQLFESLLAQLGVDNPKGEAKLIAALFDGIGVQYLVIRENYPLDEIETYLIDKYCKRKQQ